MKRFFVHICDSLIKHPQYSKNFCPKCANESPLLLECINYFNLYML